ncbi:MAG: tail fiber protein [Alphaproteobacteria bacterium GM202ARS2]|nr:tail fiber protein [Alphaproteobacteria bacterium GM202ARS2]
MDSVQVFHPGYRVLDENGDPVSGAMIRFFDAGTTTPRTVYADEDLTVALGTTVMTNSDGVPVSNSNAPVVIYTGEGDYKIEIVDSDGVIVFRPIDNVKGGDATPSGTTAITANVLYNHIGAILIWPLEGTLPVGIVDANGQELSQSEFPELYALYGSTYGEASVGMFRVPNLQDRFLRGASATREAGTEEDDQVGPHSHTGTSNDGGAVGERDSISSYSQVGVAFGANSASTFDGSASRVRLPAIPAHRHTFTTDELNTSETRPVNTSVRWVILASVTQGMGAITALLGLPYRFSDEVSANPPAGFLRFNNATIANATELYISETGQENEPYGEVLALFGDADLYITGAAAREDYAWVSVVNTSVSGGVRTFEIQHRASNGTFANNQQLSVVPNRRGLKGDRGPSGGQDGWSPVLATVVDGERRVLQVTDWTGGTGTKPTTGQYVGLSGLVATAAMAQDIRGPAGPGGSVAKQYERVYTPGANSIDISAPTALSLDLTALTAITDWRDLEFLVFAVSADGASDAVQTEILVHTQPLLDKISTNPYRSQGAAADQIAVFPIANNNATDLNVMGGANVDFLHAIYGGIFAGATGPTGGPGERGWSPQDSIVADGERRVLRIADWAGGQGDKPQVGQYIGASGLVANITDGVDIRGPQGIPGDAADHGWSPQFALASDGARRVLQVSGWIGGTGTPPATGMYVGASGLVADIGDGIDIRGVAGSNGWTPRLSVAIDGERRVFRVTDWVGGTGTKPATGLYLGMTGLVADIANAIDVRGPAGADGDSPAASTIAQTRLFAFEDGGSQYLGTVLSVTTGAQEIIFSDGSVDIPAVAGGEFHRENEYLVINYPAGLAFIRVTSTTSSGGVGDIEGQIVDTIAFDGSGTFMPPNVASSPLGAMESERISGLTDAERRVIEGVGLVVAAIFTTEYTSNPPPLNEVQFVENVSRIDRVTSAIPIENFRISFEQTNADGAPRLNILTSPDVMEISNVARIVNGERQERSYTMVDHGVYETTRGTVRVWQADADDPDVSDGTNTYEISLAHGETPASIRSKLLQNADTNVLTDDQQIVVNSLYEVPSSTNRGGTGDRRQLLRVTASDGLLVTGANAETLVDGNTTANSLAGAVRFATLPGNIPRNVASEWLEFEWIDDRRFVTQATLRQSTNASNGTWRWQGSNDGVAWTNIGEPFVLGGVLVHVHQELDQNVLDWRYYRLLGVSGVAHGDSWLREIEFIVGRRYGRSIEDDAAVLLDGIPRGEIEVNVTKVSGPDLAVGTPIYWSDETALPVPTSGSPAVYPKGVVSEEITFSDGRVLVAGEISLVVLGDLAVGAYVYWSRTLLSVSDGVGGMHTSHWTTNQSEGTVNHTFGEIIAVGSDQMATVLFDFRGPIQAPDQFGEAQIDARVRALVADWAETNNEDDIPAGKIPGGTGGGGGNAFGTIDVDGVDVVADQANDELQLVAGTGIVLTPDAANDRIVIASSPNPPADSVIAGVRTGSVIRSGFAESFTSSISSYDRDAIGVPFRPTAGFDIVRVDAQIATHSIPNNQSMRAYICEISNDGDIDGTVVDVLGSSAMVAYTTAGGKTFDFASPVAVQPGRWYAVVFAVAQGNRTYINNNAGQQQTFTNNLPVQASSYSIRFSTNVIEVGTGYEDITSLNTTHRIGIWARVAPQLPTGRVAARSVVAASATTASTSAFAFKGNIIIPTEDFDILRVAATFRPLFNTGTYQAIVASINTSTGALIAVNSSESVTATLGSNGTLFFNFSPAVAMKAGTAYAVMVGRTDGANDFALPIALPTNPVDDVYSGLPVTMGDSPAQLAQNTPANGQLLDLTAPAGARAQIYITAGLQATLRTAAASVKTLYESNADTNALTDELRGLILGLVRGYGVSLPYVRPQSASEDIAIGTPVQIVGPNGTTVELAQPRTGVPEALPNGVVSEELTETAGRVLIAGELAVPVRGTVAVGDVVYWSETAQSVTLTDNSMVMTHWTRTRSERSNNSVIGDIRAVNADGRSVVKFDFRGMPHAQS